MESTLTKIIPVKMLFLQHCAMYWSSLKFPVGLFEIQLPLELRMLTMLTIVKLTLGRQEAEM